MFAEGGCAFNIQISNPGGTDIPGPIVIEDSINSPFAFMTGEPNAPWACTKFAPITCSHPGPLPAHGALDMRVVFSPGVSPETKEVTNCAILSGTPPPAGNPGATKLPFRFDDPKNALKSSISLAGGQCTAGGLCEFDLQLTNTGPLRLREDWGPYLPLA